MQPQHRIPLLALTALGLFTGVAGAQQRIQILHASDLEGGVDAISDAPNFAAVVEALEADAATASIPSLLLSAGDNYIPGPFFSAAGDRSLRNVFRSVLGQPDAREGDGRIDISIMNLLGFDASAIGNHEFDNGPDTFSSIIGTDIRNNFTEARWLGAQFPYLSSNLDFSAEGALAGLFTSQILPNTAFESTLADLMAAAAAPKLARATTVEIAPGELVGIVGATTPLVGSITSLGDVDVRDPGAGTNDMAALATLIQPEVDALTAAGVDKIVLVTHLQQFSLEQELIGLLQDVDIVIAGGSDTRLADSTDRLAPGDVAQGPYPFVSTNASGQPALLVSTDGQYSYVGRLVVDFDASGVVVPTSVVAAESGAFVADEQQVIDLAGSLANGFAPGTAAADVQTLVQTVSNIVNVRDGNIVGRASVFLEGRRAAVRTEETNMGDLTADANLAIARSFDTSVLVSHKNGGGIRNPIGSIDGETGELGPTRANPLSGKQAGEISQLDIENTLRFNNGLALLTLTRAQLLDVLEHAVAASGPGNTPGQFGQFAGLSFSFDDSRAPGDRVRYAALTADVHDPILVIDGDVNPGAPVRLVTLNFLADGGDGYPFPAFEAADPAFANRVDLPAAGLPIGNFDFADAGTEQDALAEYLFANFFTTPYAQAEAPVADDQRIQQIGTRPTLTITGDGSRRSFLRFEVSGADPYALALLTFGNRAGDDTLGFGGFGSLDLGIDAFFAVPIGVTDANGEEDALLRVPGFAFFQLERVAQIAVLGFPGGSFAGATTEAGAFTFGG